MMCLEMVVVTVELAYAMVVSITLARAMVVVVAPMASMKARWSMVGGGWLLFRPSPRRPLP